MNPRKLPRPRPEMSHFEPYRTQSQPAEIRIHANEWPEPNPAARYITSAELDAIHLNRYPTSADELSEALAAQWSVSPDQLIFGNGSNEVLLRAFLAFGGHGRTTLLLQPTYSMHRRLARLAGGDTVDELIGLPYEVTKERALQAVDRVRPNIIVFTTPNNPTGNTIAAEVILGVADAQPDALVLVDEAYAEFAGSSLIGEIAGHPNLAVSRTFSKVRAAAALRVGVLAGHPEIVGVLETLSPPFMMSSLTVALAARIARDTVGMAHRRRLAERERHRVEAALRAVPSIEVFPSVTNFVLFRLRAGESRDAHQRFLARDVLIRDVSDWPGCERCLRASIGTPAENDRFIAAIGEVFDAQPRA